MDAALAAPIDMAVLIDWTKMMASTATSSGSYCLMRFVSPVLTAASAPDCEILLGMEMTPKSMTICLCWSPSRIAYPVFLTAGSMERILKVVYLRLRLGAGRFLRRGLAGFSSSMAVYL